MSHSYDLWDFSQETPPIRFTQPYNPLPDVFDQESEEQLISKFCMGENSDNSFFHASNEDNTPSAPNPNISLRTRKPETTTQSTRPQERRDRRRRKIKPSPYHNYQKHLNIALKHLLVLEEPTQQDIPEIRIAFQLWQHFINNESSTKKILHYIFNERNQHPMSAQELAEFGLMQVYQLCRGEQLNGAKNFLTQLAIRHLADSCIDDYLKTRRIKNTLKFKKYLQVFRKQLEDGFIKKRFTNRLRRPTG